MSAESSKRLDQFVDAAFAFAVTLLVISGGAPENLDALVAALLRIPAFAMSFALIAMFWLAHRDYARLTTRHSAWSTTVSLAIVFTVLIYVFPLRVLSESALYALSGGLLPGRELLNSFDDLRTLYLVYASGFVALSGLYLALFASVKPANAASDAAMADAGSWTRSMSVLLAAGLLSVVTALAVPIALAPWAPGMVYGLIPLGIWLGGVLEKRRLARAARAAEPSDAEAA